MKRGRSHVEDKRRSHRGQTRSGVHGVPSGDGSQTDCRSSSPGPHRLRWFDGQAATCCPSTTAFGRPPPHPSSRGQNPTEPTIAQVTSDSKALPKIIVGASRRGALTRRNGRLSTTTSSRKALRLRPPIRRGRKSAASGAAAIGRIGARHRGRCCGRSGLIGHIGRPRSKDAWRRWGWLLHFRTGVARMHSVFSGTATGRPRRRRPEVYTSSP